MLRVNNTLFFRFVSSSNWKIVFLYTHFRVQFVYNAFGWIFGMSTKPPAPSLYGCLIQFWRFFKYIFRCNNFFNLEPRRHRCLKTQQTTVNQLFSTRSKFFITFFKSLLRVRMIFLLIKKQCLIITRNSVLSIILKML